MPIPPSITPAGHADACWSPDLQRGLYKPGSRSSGLSALIFLPGVPHGTKQPSSAGYPDFIAGRNPRLHTLAVRIFRLRREEIVRPLLTFRGIQRRTRKKQLREAKPGAAEQTNTSFLRHLLCCGADPSKLGAWRLTPGKLKSNTQELQSRRNN